MNASLSFKQSIERVDCLPALPIIAQKILGLNLETTEGEGKLLELIVLDPLISAKLIGLSKSTLFGAPGMIASVKDAAMRLGMKTIKSVAIGIATMEALNKTTSSQLKKTDLWTHSISVAMAMKVLSKHMPASKRPLDDQMFMSGLLHDIGYIVVDHISPQTSDSILNQFGAENDEALLTIEKQILGLTHAEVGGKLAFAWDLADELVEVVRHHHSQSYAGSEVGQTLVRLVYLAERIITPFGVKQASSTVDQVDWSGLGINLDNTEDIIVEVQQEITKVNQFFQI
jgi:HD-like signal output (HDOD) protein